MKILNHKIDILHEDHLLFYEIFGDIELRNASISGTEIKIERHCARERSFKYWDSPEGKSKKKEVQKKVDEFNASSKKYRMYLAGETDYESEIDNDNNWPATWEFGFEQK